MVPTQRASRLFLLPYFALGIALYGWLLALLARSLAGLASAAQKLMADGGGGAGASQGASLAGADADLEQPKARVIPVSIPDPDAAQETEAQALRRLCGAALCCRGAPPALGGVLKLYAFAVLCAAVHMLFEPWGLLEVTANQGEGDAGGWPRRGGSERVAAPVCGGVGGCRSARSFGCRLAHLPV